MRCAPRRRAGRSVTVSGSFLIAHFGYSGPAALDFSRHWLRAQQGRGAAASTAPRARGRVGSTPAGPDALRVTVNLVPGTSREALAKTWLAAAALDARTSARRFLGGLLPDPLRPAPSRAG